MDVSEPLLLLGTCNDWGRGATFDQGHFRFVHVEDENHEVSKRRESRLQLEVTSRKVSFQIVSARRLWDWRIYPSGSGSDAKELGCDLRSSACLTSDPEDPAAHGRNFRLRENPGVTVDIRVLLSDNGCIWVWYTRSDTEGLSKGEHLELDRRWGLQELAPWLTLEEVEPLRLVGSFCKWDPTAEGLVFKRCDSSDPEWWEYQLCLRMDGYAIKFKIISDKSGARWRLFPRHGRVKGVLPRHGKDVEAMMGGEQDAKGKNFRIREAFLSVLTIRVRIKATGLGSKPEEARVCYSLDDTGVQAVLGRRTFQYPPKPITKLDLMIKSIIEGGKPRELLVRRLQGIVSFAEGEIQATLLNLAPLPGLPRPPPVRVAAMLMLRPSALIDCPEVFLQYLRYHLLAPRGPCLAHIFIYVDEPVGAEDEDADGDPDGDLGGVGELTRWLAACSEASDLLPRVTVLDGSGHASLAADSDSGRPAEHDAEVRAAALAGELVAKQLLNMQRCVQLAEAEGMEWLLCNLDADEALMSSSPVGSLLAAAPPEVWQVQVLNHEAVPEEAAECAADFFRGCTLFKRNALLLMQPTEEQRARMRFWGERVVAAAAEVQESNGVPRSANMRSAEGYFTGYVNGKSAVRVAVCRSALAFPETPHYWRLAGSEGRAQHSWVAPSEAASGPREPYAARADPEVACILHYQNCQGVEGLLRKYSVRAAETWNPIEFHRLCQQMHSLGSGALAALIKRGLILGKDEEEEAAAQVSAGVCLRLTCVRDALGVTVGEGAEGHGGA